MYRRNPVVWLACAAALITHPAAAQIHFEGGWTDAGGIIVLGTDIPGTGTVENGGTSRTDVVVGGLAEGTLNIHPTGSLTVTELLTLGEKSTGTLNVTGGSLHAAHLVAGTIWGSGTVNISGGTVNVGTMTVGLGTGPSSVSLSGGSLSVDGNLVVSRGDVEVSGGALDVGGDFELGDQAFATLTLRNGGAVTVTNGKFYVGYESDSSATIEGGSLKTGESWIGYRGNGEVHVSAGTWTASSLNLGMHGSGTLEISGSGAVNAAGVGVGGLQGEGTLLLNGGTLESDLVQLGYLKGGTLELNAGTLLAGNVTAESDLDEGAKSTFVWNGGTLKLKGDQSNLFNGFGSSAAELRIDANGAWLDTNGFDATVGVGLQGDGALHKTGEGTLTFAASQAYTGATLVEAGSLRLQNGSLASEAVTLADGTTFYFTSGEGNETSYAGNISGEGQVVIHGTGRTVLSGENTYSGTTTIESGELVARSDAALSASSALTILDGAKLTVFGDDEDGYLVEVGSLAGAGTVELGSAAGLIVGGDGSSTTFSGSIVSTGPATGLEKTGSGKLTLTGDSEVSILMLCGCSLTNELEINGGSVTSVEFLENFGGALSVVNGGRLEADIVLSFGPLRVRDNGSQVVAGAMSFAGEDAILEVGEGASLSTASVTISEGAQAVVNGTVQGLVENNTSLYVEEGAIVSGSGTIGELEIDDGGILSPGNSLGTLTASNTTWLSGGVYLWEINDATGAAGTNWDLFNVNGTLSLADISADNPFTIALRSLGLDDNPGEAANFDPTRTYTWTIVMASGGITDFDAAGFSIDSSGFANAPGSNRFSLSSDGARLTLTYSAVPEPAHIGLGIGTLLLALAAMRRRRA